ncbi:MAG: hypothetical protein RR007_06795 [Kiritimatiellia bacterium]
MSILPIINPFEHPCEIYLERDSTQEVCKICNHNDAAKYILSVNEGKGVECHIDKYLQNSKDFKTWRNIMPSKTPGIFADYQQRYPKYDKNEIIDAIDSIDAYLLCGQFLFHGGVLRNCSLSSGSSFVLSDVLSTTFCPRVALSEAIYREKAYNDGELDLCVIKNNSKFTKCFSYKICGTKMKHEKEVLLQANCNLQINRKTKICCNYQISNGRSEKIVPAYLVEIEIL